MAKQIAPTLLRVKANLGHIALAELETFDIIKCIITQNIDGLHQPAGSKCVYEEYSSLRTFIYMDCASKYLQDYIVSRILTGRIPKYGNCGSYLKRDLVMFGEILPIDQI